MTSGEAKQENAGEVPDPARRCLANMSAHFRESGSVWEKTAPNVVEELTHFNIVGAREAKEDWQPVTLDHLRTAFWQSIREMEAIEYMSVTTAYREALVLGKLIDQAIAGVAEGERLARLEKRTTSATESRCTTG